MNSILKSKIKMKNFGFKNFIKGFLKNKSKVELNANNNIQTRRNLEQPFKIQEDITKNKSKSNVKNSFFDKEGKDSIIYNKNKDLPINLKNNKKNEVKNIKENEIYSYLYNQISPFKKDPDFGIINTYELNEDKGLEVFNDSNLLVNKLKSNNENNLTLPKSDQELLENIKDKRSLLSLALYEKLKKYNSNYKQEYEYILGPTEERWYKEIVFDNSKSNNDMFIKSKNQTQINKKIKPKGKSYFDELEERIQEFYPEKFLEEISTPFEKYVDNFYYLSDKNSKYTKKFVENEKKYSEAFYKRYSNLYDRLNEELQIEEESMCPFNLNGDIMVFNKKFDHFTLYIKYDSEKTVSPNERGTFHNTPFYKISENVHYFNTKKLLDQHEKESKENLMEENNEDKLDNSIYEIFGINDLNKLMNTYENLDIINFVKDILDRIEEGEVFGEGILKTFYFSPDLKYLVILSTNESSSTYNMIIKDLKLNVILPVIFKNVDISIAFDKHGGIYYTELDNEFRPSKVFRHQIGHIFNDKVVNPNNHLVYHEKNNNFKLRTYNCNSNDFIYLEIYTGSRIMSTSMSRYNISDFYDKCNEIWYLNSSVNVLESKDQEFKCVKKIENMIYYSIQYSRKENSFYILQNADKLDKFSNKLVKIDLNKIQYLSNDNSSNINNKEFHKVKSDKSSIIHSPVSSEIFDIKQSNQNFTYNDEFTNLKELREVKSLAELQTKTTNVTRFNVNEDIEIRNTSKIDSIYDLYLKNSVESDQKIIENNKSKVSDIIDFIVNENYLITHEFINDNVISSSSSNYKEIFKVKNIMSGKTYIIDLSINSNKSIDYSVISKLQLNFNYNGSYLYFSQSSLAKPNQIINLSLGTQISYSIHRNYIKDDIDSETIFFNVGDGTEIPVLMYYNSNFQKKSYTEMIKKNQYEKIDNLDEYLKENRLNLNKIIVLSESSLDKTKAEFNITNVSLLNRGFTLCIPICRGSLFFDNDWYSKGIKENKYFNATDFIEVCAFLKDKKLTTKLILFSSYLGSINSMLTIINSTSLIDLAIFYNGIFDLMDLLKSSKSSKNILNSLFTEKVNENEKLVKIFKKEYGNPNFDIEAYKRLKDFSPYQLYIENRKNVKYPKMIFFTSDCFEYKFHSDKMVSRLRNKNYENSLFDIDPKFNLLLYDLSDYESYDEKMIFINSIIIGEMNLKV